MKTEANGKPLYTHSSGINAYKKGAKFHPLKIFTDYGKSAPYFYVTLRVIVLQVGYRLPDTFCGKLDQKHADAVLCTKLN